jgi:hypothetical protein
MSRSIRWPVPVDYEPWKEPPTGPRNQRNANAVRIILSQSFWIIQMDFILSWLARLTGAHAHQNVPGLRQTTGNTTQKHVLPLLAKVTPGQRVGRPAQVPNPGIKKSKRKAKGVADQKINAERAAIGVESQAISNENAAIDTEKCAIEHLRSLNPNNPQIHIREADFKQRCASVGARGAALGKRRNALRAAISTAQSALTRNSNSINVPSMHLHQNVRQAIAKGQLQNQKLYTAMPVHHNTQTHGPLDIVQIQSGLQQLNTLDNSPSKNIALAHIREEQNTVPAAQPRKLTQTQIRQQQKNVPRGNDNPAQQPVPTNVKQVELHRTATHSNVQKSDYDRLTRDITTLLTAEQKAARDARKQALSAIMHSIANPLPFQCPIHLQDIQLTIYFQLHSTRPAP